MVYNLPGIISKIIIAMLPFYMLINFSCSEGNNPNQPGQGQERFDVGKIARWDGTEWHSLGQGFTGFQFFGGEINAIVNDIAIDQNIVYAGGLFLNANTTAMNSIARWTSDDWQGFGYFDLDGGAPGVLTDLLPGEVNAVSVSSSGELGGTLYVGGSFDTVVNGPQDELEANNIAVFSLNVGLWDVLDSGVNGTVYAMDLNASGLFVGGNFTSAGVTEDTNLIARWDGQWFSMDGGVFGGPNAFVHAIAIDPVRTNDVYVGGNFSQAGNIPVTNIARWSGNQWQRVGGLNGTIYDIAISNGVIYAAGQFFADDFESFYLLASWDGSGWTYLGNEIIPGGEQENYNKRGYAVAVNGNEIYLGGNFETISGQTVNHVAKLNGDTWQDLTGGVHNLDITANAQETSIMGVTALAVSGNDVYVGGTFSAVGK